MNICYCFNTLISDLKRRFIFLRLHCFVQFLPASVLRRLSYRLKQLNIYVIPPVRPTTQMSLSTPTLVARSSNLKTPVATCISANGKPPGAIRCVWVFVLLTTNHPLLVYLCHEPDSLLATKGGRPGCQEKWPPESIKTLTGRSRFRAITFWCPAERHTRRRSPVLPPTTRRSSLTVSPSTFSVSLSHAKKG